MILYMRIGKLRLTHSTFGALKRSKVSWRHKKAPTLQLCVGAWTSDPRSSLPGPFSLFLGPSREYLSSGAWRVREEEIPRIALLTAAFFVASSIQDDMLRVMFSCCHPRLPEEAQVALVLNVLCGFSVGEIAAAFLNSEAARGINGVNVIIDGGYMMSSLAGAFEPGVGVAQFLFGKLG